MITLLWDKITEPSPREKYLWCHAPGHDKEWCYWDGIRWVPAGSAPGLIDDDLLSDNIVRKSDLPELLPEYGVKQLYTWIKYADDAYGHGMSDKSEIDGVYKKYIGFAYNKETPEESNLPDDYEWSPISGRDGVGVNSTVYWYIASENNFGIIAPPLYINPETAGWRTKGSDFVLDETLKYLWSFVRVGYTDGDGWQSEPYIVRSFYNFDYAEIQQQVEEDINEALVSVNNRLETVEETDALIKTDKNVGLIKLLTQYKTGERTNFADVIADAAEGVISTQVATAVHNQINTVGTDLNAIDATIKTHATALYGEHGDSGVVGEISSINDDIDALNGEAIRSVARAEAYWEWTGAKKTIIVDGHSYEVLQNENYDYASKSGVTAIRLIEDQETHESDYETLEQYNARILALGKESDEDPGFELRSTVKSMSAIKQTADNISLIVGDSEQAFGLKIEQIVGSNEGIITMVASKVVINSELIANSIKTKALEIYEENPQDPENPIVLAHLGKDGLRASNAEISGIITATSGSFSGSIYASSGEIGGFIIDNNILKSSGVTFKNRSVTVNNSTFNVIVNDAVNYQSLGQFLIYSGIVPSTPVKTVSQRAAQYIRQHNLTNTSQLINWFLSSSDASGYTLDDHDLTYEYVSGLSGQLIKHIKGYGIASWFGGEKIDLAVTESDKAAKTLFRFDGSGYLASNSINWDTAGVLNINKGYLGGFEISEGRIGGKGTVEDPDQGLTLTDEYLTYANFGDIDDKYYDLHGTAGSFIKLIPNAGTDSYLLNLQNNYTRTSGTYSDDTYGCCLNLSCSGYDINAAICISNGQIFGLSPSTQVVTGSSVHLSGYGRYHYHNIVIPWTNSNIITISIGNDLYQTGTEFFIMKPTNNALNVQVGSDVTVYTSAGNRGYTNETFTVSTTKCFAVIMFTSATEAYIYCY